MGFIKDAKVASLTSDAQQAYEAGDYFFTPLLNMPATQYTGASGNIRDWGLMIQGVESVGWTLYHWSVVQSDGKSRPVAFPLFRRRA